MKKRIAVIDLVFKWPPDGGARVDTKEILERLAQDFEVCLFIPAYDYVYNRGQIEGDLGFSVKLVPVSRKEYRSNSSVLKMKQAIDQFDPHMVFMTDGWHSKPRFYNALSDYPRALRFYAYENLCLKNHGLMTFRHKVCDRQYLRSTKDYLFCQACTFYSMVRHKNKMFWDEYTANKAYLPAYASSVRKMLGDSDLIICYNPFIQNIIAPHSENTQITPSGVDADRFAFQEMPKGDMKKILFSGRVYDPLKGFRTVRQASEILARTRKDFQVLFTAEDSLGVTEPYMQFVPWQKPEDLPAFYAEAYMCLVPSIWPEPFGMVTLESMSVGRPVIVSQVGGLQSIFQNGIEGLIVPPDDGPALAKAMDLLLSDPELARKMGIAGRKKVLSEYTWDVIYQKYYKRQFEELCQRKK